MRALSLPASSIAVITGLALFAHVPAAQAQIRANPAELAEAGVDYQEMFQLYSSGRQRIFVVVTNHESFNTTYGAIVDLEAIARSFTTIAFGAMANGVSFADSYDVPMARWWKSEGWDAVVPLDKDMKALVFVDNVILRDRNFSIGVKWFKEFHNSGSVEGKSVQIAATITF